MAQETREPQRLGFAGERGSRNASGLLGMWERLNVPGGTLQIESAPQQGTELKILFPVEA